MNLDIIKYYNLGGVFMHPILFLSILSVAFVLERVYVLIRTKAPVNLVWGRLESFLAKGDLSRALSFLELSKGLLPKVLWTYLSHYREGEKSAFESAEIEASQASHILERRLGALPTIANLSTLLGLLGTISWLIKAFFVIWRKGGPVDPSLLAGGIAEAMITTYAGLVVAIPTTAFHGLIEGAVDTRLQEIELALAKLKAYMESLSSSLERPIVFSSNPKNPPLSG
jgi:biopolymer transport protein ExbB